ncbi:MarR family winged helix-turn-helix transcriptional regulator [Cellulomonas sp. ACRRI]|uniref:MarR family winged helix-turn-helix transcriptional regulator n=1 Tax=Cellulomonas sp. ACRRI TaxID=2918188 RepID=UPI001EF2B5D8|nr:MarR family winged helix-turn-helix transcriptional regulator [Cellulomonas sp. ACRRI]MCG7287795.1 MarR family winged helix-turn-helix transcriptional regulator [Cellulomonas sp. ACRRI]
MDDPNGLGAHPLSYAIFRLARLHKALAGRLLRDAGLRPGQELVLMTLWQNGPQRQVDLVRTLDSDAPTMARSIARLANIGLVRREPSPTDRRVVIVHPTEAALDLRQKVTEAWDELERATVGELTPTRVQEMLDALSDLEANLAAVDPAGG